MNIRTRSSDFHLGSWVQKLPDLPKEKWCDFRRDFESGMNLKAIGETYVCDPRTVRRCILENLGSTEIGKRTAEKKLDPYLPVIQRLYEEKDCDPESGRDHVSISRKIHEELVLMGYPGGERTVRNYLNALEKKDKTGGNNHASN